MINNRTDMRIHLWQILMAPLLASNACMANTSASSVTPPAPDRPTAVIVELFTSEGCSSCPPADDVLTELVKRQPLHNVTIIGLGEHVDYWDQLGWRDPFSSEQFTSRQSEYESRVFHFGSIYTPQLVVDGRFQVVGSDRAAVRRIIGNAAQSAKATVNVTTLSSGPNEARVEIDIVIPTEISRGHTFDVVTGIVENGLTTQVRRGENGGRLLKHSSVARRMTVVGTIDGSTGTFSRTVTEPLPATWNNANLQTIAFVQDRSTRAIVGAGVAAVSPQ
jgi:hypothetical protein